MTLIISCVWLDKYGPLPVYPNRYDDILQFSSWTARNMWAMSSMLGLWGVAIIHSEVT